MSVLTDLNGITLDAFLTESPYSKERRQLGNADIRTTVITGFKDEDVLYDIFYRINTGSVPLSSQELRQVLNRGEFAKYLLQITGDPNPLWNVLGIDAPDPRLTDVELLLRLIAWQRFSQMYRENMKAFLDDSMKNLNLHWAREGSAIEDLTQQLFLATGSLKTVGRKNPDQQRDAEDAGKRDGIGKVHRDAELLRLDYPPVGRAKATTESKKTQKQPRRDDHSCRQFRCRSCIISISRSSSRW